MIFIIIEFMNDKNIAVMILGPLGDVVNTSGVFRQLKKHYPDSILSIISSKSGVIASRGIPEIDEAYEYTRVKGFDGFKASFDFAKSVRNKFDLLIILDNSFRSAFLGFLIGTKKRIGRRCDGRTFLLTDTIPYLKEEKNLEIPVTEHYARCLIPLGVYEENIDTHYTYSKEDEDSVLKLISENNLEGKKILGFSPICHKADKSMRIEDVEGLIKLIKSNTDYEIAFLGGDDVTKLIAPLKKVCAGMFVDLTGKTTFTQAACLIDKCSKFVSVDTSLMHLAFAVKTPVVSVFFTNIFKKWGPRDLDFNRLILNMETSDISPKEVFEKLNELNDKIIHFV